MKAIWTSLLAVATVCNMIACSPGANANRVVASGVTMVKTTDARGPTLMPAAPRRIVDISGSSDSLALLGLPVVGTANSDAYNYRALPSYLEAPLKTAKIIGYSLQSAMDAEAIIALQPDLIIMSTTQESLYPQLKALAPTVMIQRSQMDWTVDLQTVAALFGRQSQAENWLRSYRERAQALGIVLKQHFGANRSYLALLASGGSLFVFDAAGMGSLLYQDLGLNKPPGLPVQSSMSLPVVSGEGLSAIDADFLIVIGTPADLANLKHQPVWGQLKAVKAGQFTTLPASPYFTMGYSPVGRERLLEELPTILRFRP